MSSLGYGGVGTGQGSTPPRTGGSPVSAFCSMFSQLLKLFPRTEFQALVKRTHAERHARGFTCWGQFVAMLFCQLGRAHSLREICGGLRSSEGKLQISSHIPHEIVRSTGSIPANLDSSDFCDAALTYMGEPV